MILSVRQIISTRNIIHRDNINTLLLRSLIQQIASKLCARKLTSATSCETSSLRILTHPFIKLPKSRYHEFRRSGVKTYYLICRAQIFQAYLRSKKFLKFGQLFYSTANQSRLKKLLVRQQYSDPKYEKSTEARNPGPGPACQARTLLLARTINA